MAQCPDPPLPSSAKEDENANSAESTENIYQHGDTAVLRQEGNGETEYGPVENS